MAQNTPYKGKACRCPRKLISILPNDALDPQLGQTRNAYLAYETSISLSQGDSLLSMEPSYLEASLRFHDLKVPLLLPIRIYDGLTPSDPTCAHEAQYDLCPRRRVALISQSNAIS